MAWRQRDGRASVAARRILPAAQRLAGGCRRFARRGAGRARWARAAPGAMDLSPCLHWVRTRLWRCRVRRRQFCSKCRVSAPAHPFPLLAFALGARRPSHGHGPRPCGGAGPLPAPGPALGAWLLRARPQRRVTSDPARAEPCHCGIACGMGCLERALLNTAEPFCTFLREF